MQLGSAVGAFVHANLRNLPEHKLIVYVKRMNQATVENLHALKRPIVWDILDSWPQPAGNLWPRSQAVLWLQAEIKRVQPSAMVFPTQQMLKDSEWRGPSLVLPHHAWEKYSPMDNVGIVRVAYEGAEHYLGVWRERIAMQCKVRGWQFTTKTPLDGASIGIAVREQNGYPARYWKSNVKLANIQACGIPAICSPEQGYREFSSGAELWVESINELRDAFDLLTDEQQRKQRGALMHKSRISLSNVATRYRKWLNELNS